MGAGSGSKESTMAEISREALYWQPGQNGRVLCQLCPHLCKIMPGQHGLCLVRRNAGGRLIPDSYGKVTSLALDPIEKKPLYRFFPGSRILSVGSYGCNFHCGFCQNWSIARQEAPYRELEPVTLAEMAVQAKSGGNIGLAYTYNEPLVGYEYVLDCARLIRQHQLKNVLVTNGYINPEPMAALLPYIDAMNIDLKAWNQDFYSRICGGKVEPVRQTIALCARACHVEITTLLIPGLNDQEGEIQALAEFLAAIDPDMPLHLTRHHPDYKMAEPAPISSARMEELAALARKSLKNVWLGNL
jgi:pyruvate formate lyase activating enzyme